MTDPTQPRKPPHGRDPSRRCPICGEAVPVDREDPFCTDRCKKIDLGKWLSGDYRISRPIEQSDLDEGE